MVTGASGFIGKNLVSKLCSDKNQIIEVSLNKKKYNSYYSRMDELPNVEFIIHLGEESVRHLVNEMGVEYLKESKNIINKLIGLSSKKIIYISSGLVYGDKSKKPHSVEDKLHANDIYLKSKIYNEKLVLNADGIVLRCSNIIGSGMSKQNVLSHIFEQLFSPKDIILNNIYHIRDYIFIEDVTEIILKCLEKNISGIFNVGTGIGTSVEKLANISLKCINNKSKKIISKYKDKKSVNILNISKTKSVFSWSPMLDYDKKICLLINNSDCIQNNEN